MPRQRQSRQAKREPCPQHGRVPKGVHRFRLPLKDIQLMKNLERIDPPRRSMLIDVAIAATCVLCVLMGLFAVFEVIAFRINHFLLLVAAVVCTVVFAFQMLGVLALVARSDPFVALFAMSQFVFGSLLVAASLPLMPVLYVNAFSATSIEDGLYPCEHSRVSNDFCYVTQRVVGVTVPAVFWVIGCLHFGSLIPLCRYFDALQAMPLKRLDVEKSNRMVEYSTYSRTCVSIEPRQPTDDEGVTAAAPQPDHCHAVATRTSRMTVAGN